MISKKNLEELIRKEVWAAAAEVLKREKQASKKMPRPDAPPELNDRDFDNLLFNGGYEDFGFHKTVGLSESVEEVPQINAGEIQDFERQFADILSKYPNTTVSFDPQGKQKKSMMFKPGAKGFHVQSSGYIQVGNEGTLRWMFSIPNGFKIETEGIEISQANRDLFSDLYNFYNEWQKQWRQRLSGNTLEDPENPEQGEQPGDGVGAPFDAGGSPTVPGDASMGVGTDAGMPGSAAGGPAL